jgi:WD40 repeat protein
MGVVYKAKQLSLNRLVALKMIRAGLWAGDDEVRRFQNEAEAVANLDHPRIVTIHEVGQYEGYHYFSMRLVEGPSLEKVLDQYAADPLRAARLVSEVARAVHHAHQRGILHRDLKPSNILLDREGRPHVTDFGLAKKLQGSGALSVSGSIVGTPQYMSPEQASGSRQGVTTATDVYGLGALLYAALTGRPPFQADSVVETLRQVQEKVVGPPSQVNRKVDRDLETICLKCLEKDPRKRYGSADGLADDLERYLRGEPILARRTGPVELVVKWARRRPAIAALWGLVILVSVLGLGGVFWQWKRAEDRSIEARRVASRLALDRGLTLCRQADAGRGMLWLARSLETAPFQDVASRRIARLNLSAWQQSVSALRAVVPIPGRGRIVLGPDGKILFRNSIDGSAWLCSLSDGAPIGQPLSRLGRIAVAAFRPDGKVILTGGKDGIARLWNTTDSQLIGQPMDHGGPIMTLAFRADGQWGLTGGVDGKAQVWSLDDQQPVGPPQAHRGPVTIVTLSPDGRTILTDSPADGARLTRFPGGVPIGRPLSHHGPLAAAVFSPDGQTLLTASVDHTARLWRVTDGTPVSPPLTHQDQVLAAAFRSDGKVVLTASADGTARLWDAGDGTPILLPMTHPGPVLQVAFGPDDRLLLTAGSQIGARLWRASDGAALGSPMVHPSHLVAAAFRSDGRSVLTYGVEGTARLWDAMDRAAPTLTFEHVGPVRVTAFSSDGARVLTASENAVRLWRAADGKPIGTPLTIQDEILAAAFRSDGKVFATGGVDGTVRLWSTSDGTAIGPPLQHGAPVTAVCVMTNGQMVVTGGDDGKVRLWKTKDGSSIGSPIQHEARIAALALSPDGQHVLTGAWDNTARLWSARGGAPIGSALTHQNVVQAVAFSPNGRVLLTGSKDNTARLWRAADGRPIGAPLTHNNEVQAVAFSPDGILVLTGGEDNTARLWDAADGTPIGPPLIHHSTVHAVAFRPDGRALLTGCEDETTHLWPVPAPLTGKARSIVLWTQAMTGLELAPSDSIRVLDAPEWEAHRLPLQPPSLRRP